MARHGVQNSRDLRVQFPKRQFKSLFNQDYEKALLKGQYVTPPFQTCRGWSPTGVSENSGLSNKSRAQVMYYVVSGYVRNTLSRCMMYRATNSIYEQLSIDPVCGIKLQLLKSLKSRDMVKLGIAFNVKFLIYCNIQITTE